MPSYNRVILAGNLVRDVELKSVGSGSTICNNCLAISDRVKNGDEWQQETAFVDITIWGRSAEILAKYCSKGSPILVEGRLKQDQWEHDGQKRSKLKVVVERFEFLSSKSDSPSNQGSYTQPAPTAASTAPDGDDIPF